MSEEKKSQSVEDFRKSFGLGAAKKSTLKKERKKGPASVLPMIPQEVHLQRIFGNPPSKSNCYQIVNHGGHYSLSKTPKLQEYEKSFYIQCNLYRNVRIRGYFEFYLCVFYPSERADLDNALKCILDCLQTMEVIENDRKCVKIVAEKYLDKHNPRIEFKLIQVGI